MAKAVKFNDDDLLSDPDENYYDIIVVGSGITGLTTAYNILQKDPDITILILEGSDKIGGRLAISGATRGFFIDRRQSYIMKLIRELRLNAENGRTIRNESIVYYTRNEPIVQLEDMFHEMNDFVKRLDVTAKSIHFNDYTNCPEARKFARMSVKTLIKKWIINTKTQHFMRAIAYAICGVETAAISALWFIIMSIGSGGLGQRINFAFGNNDRQFIPGGTGRILEKLKIAVEVGRGEIRTSSVVQLVEFNDDCAYVTLRDGEQFKCECVVIAVPPPGNSKIRILPSNERILTAQESHEIGKGTFFLATFGQPWWLLRKFSGDIFSSDDNRNFIRLVYDATCPSTESPAVLAGFLGNTQKWSGDPIAFLKKCWTREMEAEDFSRTLHECKSYAQWEWPGENKSTGIIEGGYPMSVIKPCRLEEHANPMLMPHERVYWACSEYAQQWPGTLDGAVEAGEYAARFILFRIRPQSLNGEELRFVTGHGVTNEPNLLALNSKLAIVRIVLMGIVTTALICTCKPVKSA